MQNRERLVRSAAELFHRQGYAATSVEDLLGETGIARSNFYYHFDSKLDLAREILGRWTEQYHRALDEAWADAGSPGERLRLMADLLGPGTDSDQELLACPLGALALELAPHDPDIRESLGDFFDRLEDRLQEIVTAGAAPPQPGNGAGDSPDPFVAMATLVGGLMMCHAFRDRGALDRVGDGLERLVASPRRAPDTAGAGQPEQAGAASEGDGAAGRRAVSASSAPHDA